MDFNAIKQIANNESVREMAKFPTKVYREYASTISVERWLKIYWDNEHIAMWMHKWMIRKVWKEPFHINLLGVSNDGWSALHDVDCKLIGKLFSSNKNTQKLTINASFLDETIQSLIKLNLFYLNSITIHVDKSVPAIHENMPCLEELTLICGGDFQVPLRFYDSLRNIKTLNLIDAEINQSNLSILTAATFESITMKNVKCSSNLSIEQFNDVYKKTGTRTIKISKVFDCDTVVKSFFQCCKTKLEDLTELTVEISNCNIDFEHLFCLKNLYQLKVLCCVDNVEQYQNLMKSLEILEENKQMNFLCEIDVVINELWGSNLNVRDVCQQFSDYVEEYMERNSHVLIFVE